MTKKKIIIGNFLVFFALLIILELILGDWFSKYNFGYHMRDKRLVNYSVNTVKPTINLFREIIICIGLFLLVTYTGHLENLIFIIPFIFLIILILKKINRSIQDWSKTRIQNKENLVKLKYGLIHGVKEILISGRITNLIKHFNKN